MARIRLKRKVSIKRTITFKCGKCGRKRTVRPGQTIRCCGVVYRF